MIYATIKRAEPMREVRHDFKSHDNLHRHNLRPHDEGNGPISCRSHSVKVSPPMG